MESSTTTSAVRPLEKIRVLDFGSYVSAPFAAMMLGELGADVIKIERPDASDPSRNVLVNNKPSVFFAFNRNKRGILIDYRSPDGMAILEKLVGTADVALINFRPGVETRLGIDAARLQAINPRLIYCSITGFGATGPYERRPAYDNVGQTASGISSRFHQGVDPRVAGPAFTDSVTGMQACVGILAALLERETTGKGRKVEVNLLESMVSFAIEPLMDSLCRGHDPHFYYRGGASQAYILTCRDGLRIGVHLSWPDKFWRSLTAAIDRPDLAEKYPGVVKIEKYDEIAKILAGVFAQRDRDEWAKALEANDVPFALERSLFELSSDPQITHLQTFSPVDPSLYGASRMPNRAIRFDGDNRSVFLPAPDKGADTEEILRELGIPAEAISDLKQAKIVI